MAILQSYPLAVPTMVDNLIGTKFLPLKEPVTSSFNIQAIANMIAADIVANPIQIGTANGLSLNANVLSLGLAGSTTNGALSSADWQTFSNKQVKLNGVGFVKATGYTISYDNTTYVPTSRTLTINGVTHDLSANRTFPAAAPSYGQLYLPTAGYTVPIAAINVWQPLGLVATLVSPSPNFSLGIVDKCALKNISGSSKIVNVFCEIYANLPGQAFVIDGIAIALNGNVLQNSATPEVLTSQSISCIVEMQDSDEVSVYIKSTALGDADVRIFKLNVFEI